MVRVGAVEVDAPGSARGQHGEVREDYLHLIERLVEHVGPHALIHEIVLEVQVGGVVVRGEQVDGRAVGEHPDVGALRHGLGQLLHDGEPRVVLGVKDAGDAVPALAGEVPVGGGAVGEGHLVGVDEGFLQHLWAFVGQIAHGAPVVLFPAGGEDVVLQFDRVVLGGVEHDAALGQLGVAGEEVLARGEQRHVDAGVGQGEGGH